MVVKKTNRKRKLREITVQNSKIHDVLLLKSNMKSSSDKEIVRSKYYYDLEDPAKRRYEEKLLQLDLKQDPYSLKETDLTLPKISEVGLT